MRYVLDLNVALKWVLDEPDSNKARRLRDDSRDAIHELIAPDSFLLETANSLTKKERQRLIPDARTLWDDIMADCPTLFPMGPLMDRAIEISRQTRHNSFDCLYVALAEREGCELVKRDVKFVTNLQPTFLFITSLASLT